MDRLGCGATAKATCRSSCRRCARFVRLVVATVETEQSGLSTIRCRSRCDSTNVLALECAVRRRRASRAARQRDAVLLAASQRGEHKRGCRPVLSPAQIAPALRRRRDRRLVLRRGSSSRIPCARPDRGAGRAIGPTGEGFASLTDFTAALQMLEDRVLHPLAARFPQIRCELDPNRSAGQGVPQSRYLLQRVYDRSLESRGRAR